MKKYTNIIVCIVAFGIISACTNHEMKDFPVDKPESLEDLEFLNQYSALKSYIDRSANPNFKLGAGTGLSDYISKGATYLALNENFDEIVMGWEMKHGPIVMPDGSLNLENVERLITTAHGAGTSIYGHTLCWHSGQNAKYLNSIIAGEIIPSEPVLKTVEYIYNGGFENGSVTGWINWGGEPYPFYISNPGEGYNSQYALVLQNDVHNPNYWEVQAFYNIGAPDLKETFKLKFNVKGSAAGLLRPGVGYSDFSGGDFPAVNVTTEWQAVEVTMSPEKEVARLMFNFGDYVGKIYIDDLSMSQDILTEELPLGPNLIHASDFEDQDIGEWYSWGGTNPTTSISPEGEGYNGGYALKVVNPTEGQFWEGQFGYKIEGTFEAGSTYQVNLRIRGTKDAFLDANIQLMEDPWPSDAFAGKVVVTTEWSDIQQLTVTATDNNRDHFLMSIGNYEGTLWIDDITLCKQLLDVQEKSDEEKKEIITDALETFIAGMMEVCSDYIKAWDVVNEPMSDWPDPSGLKTGVNQTLAEDEFYWQDYMGKDYAAEAFKFARKYGGDDLILFMNDYGLEGSSDQAKCKGLIKFAEYTEAQGARIDGLGTQMHVTYGQTELSNIILMFQNLAATGKLIKVSELDMGYYSAEKGRSLQTEELTKEQHKEMGQFYEDIVKAYFEYIPAPQRYGITQWCPQDSSKDSGWRKGEPTGLWTQDFFRKYTYSGFAEGLIKSNNTSGN